ncbi:hypothetical protein HYG81_25650 (plasmid) [Natrinema zhouii]|uniref:hypothetical protein n=1 Tax=Natrinema zhouii TaxID=1710539 RepID=UPI001CFF7F9F|nr:hypothetical protein [Natrinema zhouii]UHQ99232.1 hypothetical protein HYG81_25650 [Natrinema zhouii]
MDVAILEVVGPPLRLELNRGAIARNIDYSPDYVGKRANLLVSCGLLHIDEDGGPFYLISDTGENVLNRDISPDDLEELGPEES